MRSRDIVRKAWQITQVHLKKLIWYGAVPSFFSVVVSSCYLAYQYNAFKTSPYFNDDYVPGHNLMGTAKTVWSVMSSHPTITVTLIVLAVLIGIGYIIVPPIFRGAMISALTKIKDYEPIEGSVEVGVRHFFPMFEFGLLIGAFGITTLFTEGSFILRWWGESAFFIALPILLFIVIVGFIISFLFTYSEYFIVLHDKTIIKSLMESAIMVISNLRKTFLVFVLIVLISARVILNVLLILIIPMFIVILASYFSSIFFSMLGFVLIGIVALAVILVSSYLMGLFHIFTTTVWVLTFSFLVTKGKFKIEDEDLDDSVKKEIPAS
jgi:MFS family permease